MARSSGARPRKAQRAEAAALRERLGQIPSHEWAKAQCVYEQLAAVCGVSGPSGALMSPRACSHCHFFGHTRQFCPRYKQAKDRADRQALQNEQWRSPRSVAECLHGAAQWTHMQHIARVVARVDEGVRLGLNHPGEGCRRRTLITSAADIVIDCECRSCVEWQSFMSSVIDSASCL